MSRLRYEQLIMLDIFIYLDFECETGIKLSKVIKELLTQDNLDTLLNKMPQCLIKKSKEEWIDILKLIYFDEQLMNLDLIRCTSYKDNIRAMCLCDNNNNAVVIFRGTAKDEEWIDNGKGAYLDETFQQKSALQFIESCSYSDIIVSGHSKGGNMAQFSAVLSIKVSKCVSVNGQGFSKEFINKYKNEIKKNKDKIICINCRYDYVNCLLENISENIHFINTEKQANPIFYHKCDILLDEAGKLRSEAQKPFFNKIINDFSVSLLNDLPKDIQIIVFDSFMETIRCVLCKEKIPQENIIKFAVSIMIVIIYGRYFKYKESISLIYLILQMYIVPFLLWGTFIECEENFEMPKYIELLETIKKFEEKPLNELERINKLCNKKILKKKYYDMTKNLKNTVNSFLNSLSHTKINILNNN